MQARIDRDKAVLLGVPVQDVYQALQAQCGSIIVSQYNQYSRIWNVILQSEGPKTYFVITSLGERDLPFTPENVRAAIDRAS